MDLEVKVSAEVALELFEATEQGRQRCGSERKSHAGEVSQHSADVLVLPAHRSELSTQLRGEVAGGREREELVFFSTEVREEEVSERLDSLVQLIEARIAALLKLCELSRLLHESRQRVPKGVMIRHLDVVQKVWSGEVSGVDGSGFDAIDGSLELGRDRLRIEPYFLAGLGERQVASAAVIDMVLCQHVSALRALEHQFTDWFRDVEHD